MVRGWDDRLIAQALGCTPNTIKVHVKHILDKLGLPDRKRLIYQALLEPSR